MDTEIQIAKHQKLIAILNMVRQSEQRQKNKKELLAGVWGRLIADYRSKKRVAAEIIFQNRVTERLLAYYDKNLNELNDNRLCDMRYANVENQKSEINNQQ